MTKNEKLNKALVTIYNMYKKYYGDRKDEIAFRMKEIMNRDRWDAWKNDLFYDTGKTRTFFCTEDNPIPIVVDGKREY